LDTLARRPPGRRGFDKVPFADVEPAALLEMIERTFFAVSTDETRYNLNGALDPVGAGAEAQAHLTASTKATTVASHTSSRSGPIGKTSGSFLHSSMREHNSLRRPISWQ
jgi:hypothetical protein